MNAILLLEPHRYRCQTCAVFIVQKNRMTLSGSLIYRESTTSYQPSPRFLKNEITDQSSQNQDSSKEYWSSIFIPPFAFPARRLSQPLDTSCAQVLQSFFGCRRDITFDAKAAGSFQPMEVYPRPWFGAQETGPKITAFVLYKTLLQTLPVHGSQLQLHQHGPSEVKMNIPKSFHIAPHFAVSPLGIITSADQAEQASWLHAINSKPHVEAQLETVFEYKYVVPSSEAFSNVFATHDAILLCFRRHRCRR